LAGKHISYSEWKNWLICPHYHKLTYIDKINKFEGNIYTAFGKALHTLCEETLTKTEQYRSQEKITTLLKEQFVKELKALPADEQKRAANDFDLPLWMSHGIEIIPDLYRSLVEKFGKLGEDWHVLAAEEFLYQPITEFTEAEKNFKGFIDLVVHSKKDEKVHLIDWKTCSWGLLKRTAKPGKKVEFVRITAAKKRTTDALKSLTTALYNITKERYIKNRNSCTSCKHRPGVCEFYRTEYCK
jgi:ATP-dependent exoDNAse (exonuclease V) beta subunit